VGLDAEVCNRPVIVPLMGGTPADQPERYAQGSPAQLLPLRVPQYLVQSSVLRPDDAEAYRAVAASKGDKVEIIPLGGRMHFNMIAPTDPTFAAVVTAVRSALGR
jgi:hypothetical protein